MLVRIAIRGIVNHRARELTPLKNSVALCRGAIDVDLLALLLKLQQKCAKLLFMNVNAFLEIPVGLFGIQFEVKFFLSKRGDGLRIVVVLEPEILSVSGEATYA